MCLTSHAACDQTLQTSAHSPLLRVVLHCYPLALRVQQQHVPDHGRGGVNMMYHVGCNYCGYSSPRSPRCGELRACESDSTMAVALTGRCATELSKEKPSRSSSLRMCVWCSRQRLCRGCRLFAMHVQRAGSQRLCAAVRRCSGLMVRHSTCTTAVPRCLFLHTFCKQRSRRSVLACRSQLPPCLTAALLAIHLCAEQGEQPSQCCMICRQDL
jgi:hypothetical protein